MKVLLKVLIVALMITAFGRISHALEILKQPPAEALKEMQEITNQVLKEGITPSPEKAISVLRYLNLVAKGIVKEDPELTKVLAVRGGFQFGVKSLIDAGITVMADNIAGKTGMNKYQLELWLKSAKNAILLDVKGQIIDATAITYRSWDETMQAVRDLPPHAPMDYYLRTLYDLSILRDDMKKEKPYLSPLIDISVFTVTLPLAFADGTKIVLERVGGPKMLTTGVGARVMELFGPKPPSDASQQAQRIVGYVNKLDNVAPEIVSVSIVGKVLYIKFNEPMGPNYHISTSGFCAGECGTWTDSWSNDRKIFMTTSSNPSPSGSVVDWTINPDPNIPPQGKFSDLSVNPAPTQSGSSVIP